MRDYDPTTGRYVQAAPSLGLVDGASMYGYAPQNPGKDIDPTGLQTRGANISTPNRVTLDILDCCEKHHPVPSAYLTIVDGDNGRKPRQGLVSMPKSDHKQLHAELNAWMATNCLKCAAGGAIANAAFSNFNSGAMIRSVFIL